MLDKLIAGALVLGTGYLAFSRRRTPGEIAEVGSQVLVPGTALQALMPISATSLAPILGQNAQFASFVCRVVTANDTTLQCALVGFVYNSLYAAVDGSVLANVPPFPVPRSSVAGLYP